MKNLVKPPAPLKVPHDARGHLLNLLLALAIIAVAVGARLMLDPLLGKSVPFITLFVAVAIVTRYCGVGAGVLGMTLGAFAAWYLFLEPRRSFGIVGHDAQAALLLYMVTSAGLIYVVENMRGSLREVNKQKELFRTTLSSIGDAVIVTDTQARVALMNPVAERLTGWPLNDAQWKDLAEVFQIVNETSRRAVESPVTKAIRAGAVVGLANHTILIARDKTELHIDDSAAPIRDELGEILGVVMVFRDIGHKREAEKKVHDSEMRYRRLFEAAKDGILILDAKTEQTIDVNRFMLELLGRDRAFVVGKELWELGLFASADQSRQAMKRTGQENGTTRYDSVLHDRDGRRVYVEFVCNVYSEGDNPVIQINVRDVSERRRMADEREAHLINERSLRMEAETANRSKDMFLATLSHEMRTPLSAIVGWVHLLQKKQLNPKDLEDGLAAIDRNSKAQVQLIEEVLDVSRIVSGKMRLEMSSCDLADAIRAGVDAVRPAATAREITLDLQLDPDASTAVCDQVRMQQVVWNLVSNSVKFTPKGGRVTVKLGREKSNLRIEVSDTGLGMSADLLPYVFDRFRQADSSSRRKFGGLGLGLSIVKHIVEAHGGTVTADSAGEGMGSTITVLIPIRAVKETNGADAPSETVETPTAEMTAKAAASQTPTIRLDGMRVLVVDDEADARNLLARVLQQSGATVMAAGSAREALDILSKVTPEVLVSDLGMPEEDGFDLIRKVRSRGFHPRDLPAVALTAFVSKEDQRAALLAGFQVHVPKPIDPEDLTAVIASLTGRTGAVRSRDVTE